MLLMLDGAPFIRYIFRIYKVLMLDGAFASDISVINHFLKMCALP
jgi:hypothetical protein